jgi:hypothetical protein
MLDIAVNNAVCSAALAILARW